MLQENFSLKNHNTFGVDVSARYFAEVNSVDELKTLLQNFKNQEDTKDLPLLLLGGGSNILFTKNYEGLIICLNLKGISEKISDDNHVEVTAAASENWHNFVQYCVKKNYGGLENLSLIPGNVGTSPIQNIGAYGVEIKDNFVSCTVLDLTDFSIKKLENRDCKFGYRDSIFKNEAKGRFVILDVTYSLTTSQHKIHSEYGAIKSELEKAGITEPTIREIADVVIAIRQSKLPDPKISGNAGSFFKNPVVPAQKYQDLKHDHPEIPGYGNGETVKIPAGWLIENCGWKGKKIGNVATHALQSLVIINATGNATGKEIYDFSTQIIDSVRDKFGVELEREVNIL